MSKRKKPDSGHLYAKEGDFEIIGSISNKTSVESLSLRTTTGKPKIFHFDERDNMTLLFTYALYKV